MRDVTIYTRLGCPGDSGARSLMIERSGRYTVPQIFAGDRHLGGCDDLYELEHAGRLDAMLAA